MFLIAVDEGSDGGEWAVMSSSSDVLWHHDLPPSPHTPPAVCARLDVTNAVRTLMQAVPLNSCYMTRATVSSTPQSCTVSTSRSQFTLPTSSSVYVNHAVVGVDAVVKCSTWVDPLLHCVPPATTVTLQCETLLNVTDCRFCSDVGLLQCCVL